LANIICVQSGRLIDGIVRPLLLMITELLLLLGTCMVVLAISPGLLGVVILSCSAAGGAYMLFFRRRALGWGKERMRAAGELQELVSNTATGISEIKVFAKEEYLSSRIYAAALSETNI